MGAGASKGSRGQGAAKKGSTATHAAPQAHRAGTGGPNEAEFEQACMAVFEGADRDGNGVLDTTELFRVMNSGALNLQLTEEEMEALRSEADRDNDGTLSYREFVPLLRQLLARVHQRHKGDESSLNAWCRLENPVTGNIFYFNKRTGETQGEAPDGLPPQESLVREFEYLQLPDGTQLTTYQNDDGHLVYMDWDTQTWQPIPEEWVRNSRRGSTAQGEGTAEDVDPRAGEYSHPTLGSLPMYLFQNERNTRLYFDGESGNWARMPLAWEFNVPEVRTAIQAINEALPDWRNANEQLLVLRECDYDVADAIAFGEINFASGVQGQGQGNSNMSVADMQWLADLQAQLASKCREVEALRREKEEESHTAKRELVRERTRVEGLTVRKERVAAEAQEQFDRLNHANAVLVAQVNELETKLVARNATSERVRDLEAELAALHSDDSQRAHLLGTLQKRLESIRLENVALKLKLQSMKEKMSKSSVGATQLAVLQRQVANLKREKQEALAELNLHLAQLHPLIGTTLEKARQLRETSDASLREITAKYLQEQTMRKLLYNKVQELRGNIRVFCRVRRDDRGPSILQFPSENEVLVRKLAGGTETMEFEHCYGPDSTQEQVFEDTKPLLLSCVDGYNVCIIAYGQTGSGKTFTMTGPVDNPGVNRRAIQELFCHCRERKEVQYTITASMMEVYNEQIYDLLTGNRDKSLAIRSAGGRTYVDGATEVVVHTPAEMEAVMDRGQENRRVGATLMNTDSSRSHLLFCVHVDGVNKITKQAVRGALTLVDLAGSERVSKTEASGERLVEAAAINKSLSALGQVFKALATNAPHVPYRNSKLTHVLTDSLGGDSKTAVFVNVSPLESNMSETHMTLKFGQGIRKIELGPASKQLGPMGPPKAAMPGLRPVPR